MCTEMSLTRAKLEQAAVLVAETDVDLWLMPSPAEPQRCLGHGRRFVITTLPAGTYTLALEVVSAGHAQRGGEVVLVVQHQ